ncbi:hypothetical protein LCGC14_2319400 [marine sediment metagenome]|uniref:Uncharacterized protein n=1 Tax=marine sediment metagenome TaxID=412755 RepID=A0A0F9CIU7_9ZZZZ
MTPDTADEVATLEDCLKSTINRAKIALYLKEENCLDLLPTILEDLFCGCQLIMDNFCIEGRDEY